MHMGYNPVIYRLSFSGRLLPEIGRDYFINSIKFLMPTQHCILNIVEIISFEWVNIFEPIEMLTE